MQTTFINSTDSKGKVITLKTERLVRKFRSILNKWSHKLFDPKKALRDQVSLDSCYPFGIGPDSKFNQLHVELFWYCYQNYSSKSFPWIHVESKVWKGFGVSQMCSLRVTSRQQISRLSSAVHVACRGRSWHFLWGPYDIIVSECCSCNWRTRCACLTRKGGDLPPLSAWKTGAKFCRCQAEACALRYFCAILVEAVVNKLLCLLSYCWTYAPSFHVSSRQFKGPWGIATRVFTAVLETL